MGLVRTKLTLANPKSPELDWKVEALVDRGALHLRVPEHPNPANPNLAGSVAMGFKSFTKVR